MVAYSGALKYFKESLTVRTLARSIMLSTDICEVMRLICVELYLIVMCSRTHTVCNLNMHFPVLTHCIHVYFFVVIGIKYVYTLLLDWLIVVET